MNLQEVKKSSIDEPHFDEKVLLATQTLNWFAVRSEKVFQQMKSISKKLPDDDVIVDSVKEQEEMRSEVLQKLKSLLEEWGNFIDSRDALDGVDEVVTTPAYDVLYNRYEPEIVE